MAAYARLHLVLPAALIVVGLLLLTSLTLSVDRFPQDAASLITEPGAHRAYTRLEKLHNNDNDRSANGKQNDRARVRQMQNLAAGAKLRNCRRSTDGTSVVICDGHRVRNRALVVEFWIGLVAGALCLMLWFYLQLRDSWMLPYWSSQLWYTPVYAALIGLVTCGPFLMASVYYARASGDYPIAPERFVVAQPSLLLYLVLLLQLTAIAVSAVKSHAIASSFASGTAMYALMILALAQTHQAFLAGPAAEPRLGARTTGTGGTFAWSSLAIVAVLLGCVGALAWYRARSTVGRPDTSARCTPRLGDLSRGLAPAWLALLVLGCLSAVGVDVGWISRSLTAAGYVACLYYVARSRADELGINRREPLASTGTSSPLAWLRDG